MKKIDFLIIFICLAGFICSGMQPKEQFAATVLDEVWQEVARNHFRKDFDTLYRKSVYEKFRPAILQSQDIPALTANLNKMLEAIGDSHLYLFGPDNGPDKSIRPVENPGPADPPADPGFTVLSSGKELLVWNVRPDSAAEEANIRPGDVLLAVEGLQLRHDDPDAVIPRLMTVSSLLERGGAGSICEVRLRSADGSIRDLRLKRSNHGGKIFQTPVLPALVLRYEARMLDDKTGYLRFNIFVPEVAKNFRKDRRNGIFKNAESLIIDLRGNPGGVLLTAEWLGAWCFSTNVPLGTLIVDGVKLAPVTEPQKGCFNGKVVVLVDENSASTSEIFAAAIQDNKVGLVAGSPTLGQCLPSMFLSLPSGFRLQVVSGEAKRPSGKDIEKIGITPDILVENGFENGQDKVLVKVLAVLKEERKKNE